MNCSEFKNKLDDFVDGYLSGGDHLEWERHLLRCSDCREEVDQLRSLIGDAARLPAEVAPARDLWPGIAARMKNAAARRSWRPIFLGCPVAAWPPPPPFWSS